MRVKIGEHLLQVSDRRNSEHIGSKRGSMREAFAVPTQMFAHSPKLALPTGNFKPSGMIEQHLKAHSERWRPGFWPLLRTMLLQNESRLLFLPKEPRSSKRCSPDQHAIDSGGPDTTDNVVIIMHISVAEQQSAASPRDLRCPGNGIPIRFSPIHLLQGAAMEEITAGCSLRRCSIHWSITTTS